MLIYDKKLLQTTRVNQLVLPVFESEEESDLTTGYIYTDLETYRQALTLNIRFESSTEALSGMLMLVDNHADKIEHFIKYAPEPLKILAPYLGLVSRSVPIDKSMEDICNYLHIISNSLSFSEFIIIPKEARVNITYTKTTFLLMDSAIQQQKNSLLDRSRYDDVADWYISNKDFELMGKCLNTISDTLGGIGVNFGAASATQVIEEEIKLDNSSNGLDGLDLELDLSDDWSGFEIPKVITEKERITSSVVQVENSVSTRPLVEEIQEPENSSSPLEDMIDKIANGLNRTNSLL